MHRDSREREGGRCWSRLSLCYASIGMIAALTKDKNATIALNDVNGGGGGGGNVSMNFLLILRSLERSIALMTSVDC